MNINMLPIAIYPPLLLVFYFIKCAFCRFEIEFLFSQFCIS